MQTRTRRDGGRRVGRAKESNVQRLVLSEGGEEKNEKLGESVDVGDGRGRVRNPISLTTQSAESGIFSSDPPLTRFDPNHSRPSRGTRSGASSERDGDIL